MENLWKYMENLWTYMEHLNGHMENICGTYMEHTRNISTDTWKYQWTYGNIDGKYQRTYGHTTGMEIYGHMQI